MSAVPAPVPAVIAGFATQVEAYDLGRFTVGLVTVRDLERHVDRDQLLRDPGVVPPYWALVWSGARVLAEHVAERVPCAGHTALDVGCGLGLVALAAACKGARVTAIDRELAPIEFLQASAAANGIGVDAMVGDVTEVDLGVRFDLVFAAELLYEPSGLDALAAALVRFVAPGGTIWVADAQRIDSGPFYAAMAARGCHVREVCACEVREEGTLLRLRLIALAPAADEARPAREPGKRRP
jgi:predicted nicotinamide N-methyase